MASALAQQGVRVEAICPRSNPLAKTASVSRLYNYSFLHPIRALARAVGVNPDTCIVPCDDQALSDLHHLHAWAETSQPSIAKAVERSIGDPQSFAIVSSRTRLQELAVSEGIRTPAGGPLTAIDDLRVRYADLPFPLILKLDGTWGGGGVALVRSTGEATTAFCNSWRNQALKTAKKFLVDREIFACRRLVQKTGHGILLQQFIPGSPANCLAFCRRGEVLALIAAQAVETKSGFGPATIIRLIRNAEIEKCARTLVRRLGLSGMCGFDFIIDGRDGGAYLIEVNARCTQLAHLNGGAGRDLVSALSREVSADCSYDRRQVLDDEVVALFPQAWSKNPSNPLLRSSYHDVPWEDVALLRELVSLPWHERGTLARVVAYLRAKYASRIRAAGSKSSYPASSIQPSVLDPS